MGRYWNAAVFRPTTVSVEGRIDPRWMMLGAFGVIVLSSFLSALSLLLGVLGLSFALVGVTVLWGRFSFRDFWWGGFGAAFVLALALCLPSCVNLFSHIDGQVIWPWFSVRAGHWGPFRWPSVIGVTREGLAASLVVFSRAMISASLVIWLALTLRWQCFLTTLRRLGVPSVVVQVAALCLVFFHVMLARAEEAHRARQARLIARESYTSAWTWVATRLGRAWSESLRLMEETHQAMLARGYRGEVPRGER
jgi:energy-coupling factor transporter transmembrane protein EcfT